MNNQGMSQRMKAEEGGSSSALGRELQGQSRRVKNTGFVQNMAGDPLKGSA